jgi:uncharacterized membrane protein
MHDALKLRVYAIIAAMSEGTFITVMTGHTLLRKESHVRAFFFGAPIKWHPSFD